MIPIQPQDAAAGAQAAVQRDIQHYMRPGTLQLGSLPPLSLYVHLPWCIRKCPYCDFNSHEHGRDGPELPEDRYIDALVADLESALPLIWGRTVHSIFIGGGTPSLFAPESIDRLLAAIRARLRMEADCEITMEANPGTFETDRFRAFRAAGVTRLSIGVQSFDDRFLQAVGRVHDGAQARAAVREAADSFETFNIDLMYALPGQTELDLARDLDVALSFAPPHLSVYHLTIEPNTYFAKFPPAIPEDDLAYDMLDRITARTAAAGMQRYEISAYAREGHQCWHNRNYWQFGDYLGIGAGAHGKLSDTAAGQVRRRWKTRHPRAYMEAAGAAARIGGDGAVDADELPFEYMLNALRLIDGVPLADFAARTGLPPERIAAPLAAARRRGWLVDDPHWLRTTALGQRFLNDVISGFLD